MGCGVDTSGDLTVQRDARNRAWRTFLQGLGIDIGTGLLVTLASAFNMIEWSWAFWAALGLLLAKTLLQSLVASIMRRVIPPPQ